MTVDIPEVWRPLLFFALLLGPTCLWLLLRALRGHTGTARSTAEASAPESEWVCETCRSVNPARARRCYKGCAPRPAHADLLVALDDAAAAVAPPLAVRPGRRHPDPVAVPVAAGAGAAASAGAEPAGAAGAPPPAPAPVAAPTKVPGRRAPARGRRSGPKGSTGVPVMDPDVAAAPTSSGGGGEVAARSGRRRVRTVPATAQPAAATAPQPGAAVPVATAVPVAAAVPGATAVPAAAAVPAVQAATAVRAMEAMPAVPAATAMPAVPTMSEGEACPFLGLRRDAGTHFEFAEPEHRCYAAGAPARVDVHHQHSFCLGAYKDCARFRARQDAVPTQQGRP